MSNTRQRIIIIIEGLPARTVCAAPRVGGIFCKYLQPHPMTGKTLKILWWENYPWPHVELPDDFHIHYPIPMRYVKK